MGIPTKPNRTGKATASDTVFTPSNVAKKIIEYFNPKGVCLEPCKGAGAFYNLMQNNQYQELRESQIKYCLNTAYFYIN